MFTVLIVEDEKIQSDMYSTLLTNHGYRTITATNGTDGLAKAREIHPDLIVTDIKMPQVDGLALMHALRGDDWGKTAKIIMLTNFDATDERLSAVIADQPTYYLIKANTPPEQLLEKVEEILNSSQT